MVPYEIYKILHLAGIFLLVSGLIGVLVLSWTSQLSNSTVRKFGFITHGTGLVFLLVSGFGLLARLGLAREAMPFWIYVKLAIWGLMGGAIAVLRRKGQIGWPLFFVLFALFLTAAYFGVYKVA